VLGGGKKLKLDPATEAKEGQAMGGMLGLILSGKAGPAEIENMIKKMVDDINNSGVLPSGVNPNNPKSIEDNTHKDELVLEPVVDGKGKDGELQNAIAAQI